MDLVVAAAVAFVGSGTARFLPFVFCAARVDLQLYVAVDQIITRVSLVKVDISSLIGHRSETARSSGGRSKGWNRGSAEDC